MKEKHTQVLQREDESSIDESLIQECHFSWLQALKLNSLSLCLELKEEGEEN